MSNYENVIPNISEYPAPQLEHTDYTYIAMPGYVPQQRTWWTGNAWHVSEPAIDQLDDKLQQIAESDIGSDLAWVNFYQRAVIAVRHPERFVGDEPGPSTWLSDENNPRHIEKVYGELFMATSPKLVTGKTEDGYSFASVEEVIKQGRATAYTESWLERYARKDNTNGFNRELFVPILPVLKPKLARDLKANKLDF